MATLAPAAHSLRRMRSRPKDHAPTMAPWARAGASADCPAAAGRTAPQAIRVSAAASAHKARLRSYKQAPRLVAGTECWDPRLPRWRSTPGALRSGPGVPPPATSAARAEGHPPRATCTWLYVYRPAAPQQPHSPMPHAPCRTPWECKAKLRLRPQVRRFFPLLLSLRIEDTVL
jgi:hypothetical protein